MFWKKQIKSKLLWLGSKLYGNDDSKVLYYHDVFSDKTKKHTQMSTSLSRIKMHFEVINEENYKVVKKITNEKHEVLITFDDGFRGLYENFSFFVDNAIYVKLFMIYNCLDKPHFLTRSELLEMFSTGFLDVGAHTMSHPELHSLNKFRLQDELAHSKENLEELLGCRVADLCYPKGMFSSEVINAATGVGYDDQYSCLPGSYYNRFREVVIRRNLVQYADREEFQYILHGAASMFAAKYLRWQFK